MGEFGDGIRANSGVKEASGGKDREVEEVAVKETVAVKRDEGDEERTSTGVSGCTDEGREGGEE